MNLPTEVKERIVSYLRNSEQYKCLILSKDWYKAAIRSLYRIIKINTRCQLLLLFSNLKLNSKNGLLIRELYLSKSSISRKSIVGITSKELNQLLFFCPYIEIIDFDQAIWKYIQFNSNPTLSYLKKLPILNENTKFIQYQLKEEKLKSLKVLFNLTELNLNGELVCRLFQENSLLRLLRNTPKLNKLCLNSQQKKSHLIQISFSDLELIQSTVPLLKSFELSGSIQLFDNLSEENYQHILPLIHLNHLKLKVQSIPTLLYYLSQKYPNLISLDLELISNYTMDTKILNSLSQKEKQEIYDQLFSHLLDCCSKLKRIEIDNITAKEYMNSYFFKKLKQHQQLEEIKLKDLPFQLLTRDQNLFKLLSNFGQDLLTGLGIEVTPFDIPIQNLFYSMSQFKQLNNLLLCCGHPEFECDFDLLLEHSPLLKNISIRSAFIKISKKEINQKPRQYQLHSLKLNSVHFSKDVFNYLGRHCQQLEQLYLYECDEKNETKQNKVNICMPFNNFEFIIMNGIRLEESSPNIRIIAVEEAVNKKIKRKWYHVYNRNNPHQQVCKQTKIQKLNQRKSIVAEQYYEPSSIKDPFSLKNKSCINKEWEQDLHYGYISIQCNSIKYWELISNTNFNEF